ncbi:hypothetical protein FOL47_007695 [Perkinsus chesapeaki]|uniref:Major facilitator superfamily (MFS) profile domain-containing protein n=1 Tax=Perkinsus chesapeaki TaxID=330153 RepID=A0A7J6LJ70_PERCH|nr:hypothetical protein FOL47_007695 [Perkinsus chesapeaki]
MQEPFLNSSPRMANELRGGHEHYSERYGLILKLGSGFFADAYDLFIIDLVLAILDQFPESAGLGLTDSTRGLVASATSFGAIAGMLFFGVIGDRVGRRAAILCTGSLVFIGSVASSLVVRWDTFPLAYQLCVARSVLGFGIGGEYPLSAAMAAEKAHPEVRGRVVAGVFSMQGVGMIAAALIPMALLSFGLPLELTWRLLMAFAVIPSGASLYWRFGLEESAAFNEVDMNRAVDIWTNLTSTVVELKSPLLGAALAWLLMDITFYGTGEFKHVIASKLLEEQQGFAQVRRDAVFALIVSLIALPGYLCSCFFIDKIGRCQLQALGFSMMALFYSISALCIGLGAATWVNLFVFSGTFFWTNFGPNVTTYIIPSETFPVQIRTTCHGICAASGKVGAVVGAYFFPVVQSSLGVPSVLVICSVIAVLGLVCTLKLVTDTPIRLDTSTSTLSTIEMGNFQGLRERPGGKYVRLSSLSVGVPSNVDMYTACE